MEPAEGKRKTENEPAGDTGMKRTIIRLAALVVVIVISVLLYTTGKSHTLIIDNKAVMVAGTQYEPLPFARVRIKGMEPLEFMPRDRDKVDLKGSHHTLTVELLSKQGEVSETKTVSIRLEESPMYLLSLPALFGGAQEYLSVFENPTE